MTIENKENIRYDRKKEMTDYCDNVMKAVMQGITYNNDVIKKAQSILKQLHHEFTMMKRIRKAIRRDE